MIPGTWWPYPTNQSCILHNLLPNSVNKVFAPLALLRGVKLVSWQKEHIGIFGHFAMVWLAPPQRGQTAKQLADRAVPAIYLGRSSTSKDSHFFLIDKQEFKRSAFYKIDHSRPPPGWPLKSGDRARSVDVLSEMLMVPDSIDVGSYLLDEIPLPGTVLQNFDEQEGDGPSMIPKDLIRTLPNLDTIPILPVVSSRFPMQSDSVSSESPTTHASINNDNIIDSPAPFDLAPAVDDHPAAPVGPDSIGEIDPGDLQDEPNLPTAPEGGIDRNPTATISSHGDDQYFHEQHCSSSGCIFPRGHSS